MITVEVKDLQVGDKIFKEDGSQVEIRNIGNGFYRGSKLIEWSGGWSCEFNSTVLEIEREEECLIS